MKNKRIKELSYMEAIGLAFVAWYGLHLLMVALLGLLGFSFQELNGFIDKYLLFIDPALWLVAFLILYTEGFGLMQKVFSFRDRKYRIYTAVALVFLLFSSSFECSFDLKNACQLIRILINFGAG